MKPYFVSFALFMCGIFAGSYMTYSKDFPCIQLAKVFQASDSLADILMDQYKTEPKYPLNDDELIYALRLGEDLYSQQTLLAESCLNEK